MNRFNTWVAEKVTSFVSTMWGAYFFAAIALISLPRAISSGDTLILVSWIAQTFLQLVLLSIIMVGQKSQSSRVETMIRETHDAALLELQELQEMTKEVQLLIKDAGTKLG